MNLFNFLFRGATVFLPDKANIVKAESNANEFALAMNVAMNELFMKIAGAAANCLICARLCKSIHHEVVS